MQAVDQPEIPGELAYLWEYFNDISMAVTPGGFGPAMATWDNIRSWSILMRVVLEPWEARMLARLSVIRANVLSAEEKKNQKKPKG
jgi:hypothetical protein